MNAHTPITPELTASEKARIRELTNARKLVETASAYLAALERSGGEYTNAAARAEIPMLDAIYAITECDDVYELANERRDEVYGYACEDKWADEADFRYDLARDAEMVAAWEAGQ